MVLEARAPEAKSPELFIQLGRAGSVVAVSWSRDGKTLVRLTFHEKNRQTIDRVDCVYVEPEYRLLQGSRRHLLLEVIPNALTGNLSDPKVV